MAKNITKNEIMIIDYIDDEIISVFDNCQILIINENVKIVEISTQEIIETYYNCSKVKIKTTSTEHPGEFDFETIINQKVFLEFF